MRGIKLKPIEEQVIFITGATSGIGLATVHLAVEQGAKVFMAARNERELTNLQGELSLKGYNSDYAVCDVANINELQAAAERCLDKFGRIDTFINNAGVSIYARLLDTPLDEARDLFETNFWGVVNGCKVALPLMSEGGGAIIIVGSVLSNVALPIQGLYSASKHAVKGFTDALRRELLAKKLPIQMTLILPSSIDTPYTEHAKTYIGKPKLIAPVYSPEVVARTILKCAVKPVREVGVGFPAYLFSLTERLFPKVQDRVMARYLMEEGQRSAETDHQGKRNAGEVRGDYKGHVRQSSLSTEIALKKSLAKGVALVGGLFYLVSGRIVPWITNERKSAHH